MREKAFLTFRVSRPGHFEGLQTGDASPLPVPRTLRERGQGVPHSVTPRNDKGLPTVTLEKALRA